MSDIDLPDSTGNGATTDWNSRNVSGKDCCCCWKSSSFADCAMEADEDSEDCRIEIDGRDECSAGVIHV